MLDDFYLRMQTILGNEFDSFMAALAHPPYQALHINTQKDSMQDLAKLFQLEKHPYVHNGYYFDKEKQPMGKLSYHDAGLYYIQEPSAMLVAELADLSPGMKVLDLCAAPGGKSTKAALMVGEDGLLVANDISNSRAKILSENIERLGFKNTVVTNTTPNQLEKVFSNFFDVVIVDAPCSGEGMFRKLDQAKATWSVQKVAECAAIQEELIASAYHMLKDEGILMYSTCTYEVQENEAQIKRALENFSLKLIPLPLQPGFCSGIDLDGVIRLYPHHFNGEGHFIAKMQKKEATIVSKLAEQKSNISKEELRLVAQFYQDNLNIPLPSHLYSSNHHIYALPSPYLDFGKIRVLRQGLYLGECKKNRFEPSLSLALSLKADEAKRTYDYHYDDEEIAKYLHGETLTGKKGNGFGLITVDSYPLGFVKEVQGVLKNFYPKGLRRP